MKPLRATCARWQEFKLASEYVYIVGVVNDANVMVVQENGRLMVMAMDHLVVDWGGPSMGVALSFWNYEHNG